MVEVFANHLMTRCIKQHNISCYENCSSYKCKLAWFIIISKYENEITFRSEQTIILFVKQWYAAKANTALKFILL